MRTRNLTVGVAALALVTAACGGGEDTAAPDAGAARRVTVTMVDIDFKPKTLDVTKGEEVRFTFTNDGKVRHEAYFGTADDQVDHEKEMAESGEDSGGHDAHGGGSGDNNKITVEPGGSGDITYRFDEAGTFEVGCHEPGHYAGGMKITVNVT